MERRKKAQTLKSGQIDLTVLHSDEMSVLKFLARVKNPYTVRELQDKLFGCEETTIMTRNALRRLSRCQLVARPKNKKGCYLITLKAKTHLLAMKTKKKPEFPKKEARVKTPKKSPAKKIKTPTKPAKKTLAKKPKPAAKKTLAKKPKPAAKKKSPPKKK